VAEVKSPVGSVVFEEIDVLSTSSCLAFVGNGLLALFGEFVDGELVEVRASLFLFLLFFFLPQKSLTFLGCFRSD
jgi:hypothetical protein